MSDLGLRGFNIYRNRNKKVTWDIASISTKWYNRLDKNISTDKKENALCLKEQNIWIN